MTGPILECGPKRLRRPPVAKSLLPVRTQAWGGQAHSLRRIGSRRRAAFGRRRYSVKRGEAHLDGLVRRNQRLQCGLT